jgi:hypothetical protein
MVTRAIVDEVISNEELRVSIAAYGEVIEEDGEPDLSTSQIARINSVPGFVPNFKKGDSVFVCIEDNDLGKPIVMGKLLTNNCDINSVGISNAKLSSLIVVGSTTLGSDTHIGEVSSEHIKCLSGATSNIQKNLDSIWGDRDRILKTVTGKLTTFCDSI